MKMNNSEVFDNLLKIAQKEGFISIEESNKNSEQAIKYISKNHRASSQTVSNIEALYGVKPNSPKEQEYKNNIMEKAHPKSVIISPSYDKLNGLVENNIERQNIILNIINKTPNGQNTQHKYAKKNLILSLVKISNFLDNKNYDELMNLSDTCLRKTSEEAPNRFKKHGILPILIGVASIIGALYLQQHLSFIDEGFETNSQKLSSEINDLLTSNSDWGVGVDYNSSFISLVQDLKSKVDKFYSMYKQISPIISELQRPKTVSELMVLVKQPQTDTVMKAYQVLQAYADNMLPYLNKIESNFKSESFKNKQIKDKGFISSLVDKTHLLHGGSGLISDDLDDVVRAIDPYIKSITDIVNILKQANSFRDKSIEDLKIAQEESQKQFGNMPATEEKDTGISDLDSQIQNLQ